MYIYIYNIYIYPFQARALLEEALMLRRIKADVETSLLPKLECVC